MTRNQEVLNGLPLNIRIEGDLYEIMKDIAALETIHTNRVVTVSELVRNAIRFVYHDNERLRECFRRARFRSSNKLMTKKFAKFRKKK